MFSTFFGTILQQDIPNEALARVSAYVSTGQYVSLPVGYALLGPLVAVAGASRTLEVAAVMVVGVSISVAALSRNAPALPSGAG